MRKCEEEVEQSNGTCLCSSKSYHLWIIVKCGNKVWSGKEDNDSDNPKDTVEIYIIFDFPNSKQDSAKINRKFDITKIFL